MQNWWSRTGWGKKAQEENLPKVLRAQALQLWKERVYDVAQKVDPEDEHEWDTLAYGFFLGLGFLPEAALEMAGEAPQ